MKSLQSDVLEGARYHRYPCDNQSGIHLLENPLFHDRSRHIDIRYHFIRDMVQRGVVRLNHIGTDEQVAEALGEGQVPNLP